MMIVVTPLGDLLPAALAGYYDALDAGRLDDALACFTTDAVASVPDAGAPRETSPRRRSAGTAAIAGWLGSRGQVTRRHRVELCVTEGPVCLVEGTVWHDGAPTLSYVASVRLAVDGRIARYLAFAGGPPARPLVPELTPLPDGHRPGDALAVFRDYLDALQEGRIDDAVSHFSTDALYSHPPYVHKEPGGDRLEFRGRDGIRAGFAWRGPASFRHCVVAAVQRGPHCMLEGETLDLPDGRTGSFVSVVSLDAHDQIRRYLSFYCEPGIA